MQESLAIIRTLSPASRRWLATAAFSVALGAAFWQAPQSPAAAFIAPPPPIDSQLPPLQQSEMLPGVARMAAAPSLAQLADGRIAASWVSGAENVREQEVIWFSTRDDHGWSEPYPVSTREETAGSIFAHIRQIDTPVLLQHGDTLHLWYTATSIGGHAGQTIIHTHSTDGGQRWQKPVRLQTTPFGNNGMLLGTPPLPLADGGIGLPASQRLFSHHGEWLRLDAQGRVLDKARLPLASAALQPAVFALDANRALAILRDGRQLRAAATDNGGQAWHAVDFPEMPNPDTPIALQRLPSGRLLLAGNTGEGRGTLALWLGDASATQWRQAHLVESAGDAAADFSEPSLLLARDGRIHLAYAWRRQGIRHLSFSEAWLDGEMR